MPRPAAARAVALASTLVLLVGTVASGPVLGRTAPADAPGAATPTVDRSATLPLALRIIPASFGVSSARRSVAATIRTIGVGSSSVSTIDPVGAVCTAASYHALLRAVTTPGRPRWGTMAR